MKKLHRANFVMKKFKSQNLLEYILIFAMIAIAGYVFAAKFDIKTLRNYVFNRPASTSTINGVTGTRIEIESMTD